MILSGNSGTHLLILPLPNPSREPQTAPHPRSGPQRVGQNLTGHPAVQVQVGCSSKGPLPPLTQFSQMPINRCQKCWPRLRDPRLHNNPTILAVHPASINIMVFEPLGPVEFTSMLSRSLHWASAWSAAKKPGDSCAFMCSQAQAALALGGALWGPSVGVNLKQRADIPVGSVTGHAWLMMPGRQVTRVHDRGGEKPKWLPVTCPQSSEGWSRGRGDGCKVMLESGCPDQIETTEMGHSEVSVPPQKASGLG